MYELRVNGKAFVDPGTLRHAIELAEQLLDYEPRATCVEIFDVDVPRPVPEVKVTRTLQ